MSDGPTRRVTIASLEFGGFGSRYGCMEAIYLSESFVVVQMQPSASSEDAAPGPGTGSHPVLTRRGFEIVDRRHNREVYLDGAWAELFARQIDQWRETSASREEVEAALEGYTALAQAPLALH